jgi:hypothetical protein
MMRDELEHMALVVAVRIMRRRSTHSPAEFCLEAIADRKESESDIALIRYLFEHPDA